MRGKRKKEEEEAEQKRGQEKRRKGTVRENGRKGEASYGSFK